MTKHRVLRTAWIIGSLLYLVTAKAAVAQQQPVIQKPPLDASVFGKWPSIKSGELSNDGRYVLYVVTNKPVGDKTLVVRSVTGDWKVEVASACNGVITQDSRKAVFMVSKDRLCMLRLGASSTECIPNVSAFQLIRQDAGELLAYKRKGQAGELVVRDLAVNGDKTFGDVAGYSFSKKGKTLLVQTESKNDGVTAQTLNWVNLGDGRATPIWRGLRAHGFVFDASGTQLAFVVEDDANNHTERSLWYYKVGTEKAVVLATDRTDGIDGDLRLYAARAFSKDGTRLFIDLKENDYSTPSADSVKVDIWSYTDPKLQSQQLYDLSSGWRSNMGEPEFAESQRPRIFLAVVAIHEPRVIRLQFENETISMPPEARKDDVFVTNWGRGGRDEWNWNRTSRVTLYLVSTQDGARKKVSDIGYREIGSENLARDGKYVVYMDDLRRNMFSYEVETGVTSDITRDLPIPMVDPEYEGALWLPPRGVSLDLANSWLHDGAGLLLYDKYDIWLLDLAGKRPPVAVTNGYGRKHNIQFRLARGGHMIEPKDRLILLAFDLRTKESGFYSKRLNQAGDPELLTMGPYSYEVPYRRSSSLPSARDAELHLVERSSATQSPNYFYTIDFKTFTPLSQVSPEAAYNWLTTELLSWKSFNGRVAQGVLYKPENFDPKKKYPIIFNYYDKEKADGVNSYLAAGAMSGDLAIPWFVSHGYLVFTPGIHQYNPGYPGRSAYDYVVSAAEYLAQFPYVDSTRMGIQGNSWGGFETNYLVTHTRLFAAAVSGSGPSDLFSDYGSLLPNGQSNQFWSEVHQFRIGATPWERPDLYLDNSAVLRADLVTTPLLLMHTKLDSVVPFAQGVEFFTALRRLGKRAWMLQYDGSDHLVDGENAAKDYTTRVTQFFDHYLKGAPPAKWMTEGVPARLKGIETGLELDTSGKEPSAGLL